MQLNVISKYNIIIPKQKKMKKGKKRKKLESNLKQLNDFLIKMIYKVRYFLIKKNHIHISSVDVSAYRRLKPCTAVIICSLYCQQNRNKQEANDYLSPIAL